MGAISEGSVRRPLDMRTALRTLMVHFPNLADARHAAGRTWRQLRRRPFEKEFGILRYLTSGDHNLFIDAGANRGQSIDAIRLFHPTGRIEAFEPVPWLGQRLTEQFAVGADVNIHVCALGEADGVVTLHTPSYNGYVFDALTSADPAMTRAWLEPCLYHFRESKMEIVESVCSIRKLDDFGLEPTFMKIDVQGAELAVLKGAHRTLQESRPVLLIETPPPENDAMLTELGYRPNTFVDDELHPGCRGPLNTVYLTEEHLGKMRSRGLAVVG